MSPERFLQDVKGRVAEADFFRFCQLLERSTPGRPPLGSTARCADDPIRLRPDPGMGFAAAELRSIEPAVSGTPATVRARFMGLYGVDSPLPTAYLDDIAQGREGHEVLAAFLDIFNHRLYTQFYRIWRKYSYPASFEAGATDATSQCLLGLIGLGIAGTAKRIGTPVSRFLALLSVMRLPTRNAEGISALVHLLAADTTAQVRGHVRRKITLAAPAALDTGAPTRLGQGTPLGRVGWEVNSELQVTLHSHNPDELHQWLPGGQLQHDLMVLLRVYLGWRCTARLALCMPVAQLPPPLLGSAALRLGMTAMIAGGAGGRHVTLALGRYQGLSINPARTECFYVDRLPQTPLPRRGRRPDQRLRPDPVGRSGHGPADPGAVQSPDHHLAVAT